jgi:hypothetical protein
VQFELLVQPWHSPPTHVSPPVHCALLLQAFEQVPSFGAPVQVAIWPHWLAEKHWPEPAATQLVLSAGPLPVQLPAAHWPWLTHSPLPHSESCVHQHAVWAGLQVPTLHEYVVVPAQPVRTQTLLVQTASPFSLLP